MKRATPTRRILIILFWVIVWQIASLIIRNDILFVGPAQVVRSLFLLLPDPDFWLSIAGSFGRITLGFLTAFILGIAIGSLAFCIPFVKELLAPLISLSKSIPVASFVILALIWIGSANLSVLISFLVVFPMIYVNTIAGLESTDPKLLEMAHVFSVTTLRRIRYIYLPALLPYLVSSCRIALGMSWKSGIAAEVIGIPTHSIGEHLYMAKIYLATSDVFAWTIVIILASALFEHLFLWLIRTAASISEGKSSRKGGVMR
ncbi:MAG: ABC transporter permease subunit [Lachnospiraceae bacterium]|nr:ABC transporter permease subunit [Lachnospiraceae bacterium]